MTFIIKMYHLLHRAICSIVTAKARRADGFVTIKQIAPRPCVVGPIPLGSARLAQGASYTVSSDREGAL